MPMLQTPVRNVNRDECRDVNREIDDQTCPLNRRRIADPTDHVVIQSARS
jgi:hypothetical protein